MDVLIRPCEFDDLAAVCSQFRQESPTLHEERFVEQQRGESTYLITWIEGRPVAHLKIRWAGSVHRHVVDQLGVVPEICRFAVLPELRGHGVGGRLLVKAESIVRERGFDRVGLAVAVANTGARRLYERTGYVTWTYGDFESRWNGKDDNGVVGEYMHIATYMVKPFRSLQMMKPLETERSSVSRAQAFSIASEHAVA